MYNEHAQLGKCRAGLQLVEYFPFFDLKANYFGIAPNVPHVWILMRAGHNYSTHVLCAELPVLVRYQGVRAR